LFDGSGREFVARIDGLQRSQVELTVTATMVVDRESAQQLVVGVTLPKGERQRWLLEKLVEIGVSRLVPLCSEHSIVHPDAGSLRKLLRFVIEASKQCGRNRLMEVAPLTRFTDFLASAPEGARRWVADPTGDRCGGFATALDFSSAAYLAVGPEGGFSPAERQSAESAGWQLVSLGPRILRIETACLVLATLAAHDLRGGDGGSDGSRKASAEAVRD
jgi:16S rRNA (uracil1498-N3)-methyltransferase